MKIVRAARKYITEIIIFVLGILSIHLIFFFSDAFSETKEIGQQSAGLFGDFVGGYFGTFFALCSALLLYSTLKNQKESTERISFETKFFELLRLHRENVAEIKVQKITGRRFFLKAWKEYRAAFDVFTQSKPMDGTDRPKNECLIAAYYCLFYGVDKNSHEMLANHIKDGCSHNDFEMLLFMMERDEDKEVTKNRINLSYKPFEGHQSRLGHYYRHLYQTIKFIDSQKSLSQEEKYSYAKLLRAQLSNHEQALLLINSLTPIGENWIKNDYLRKYKFVKNIPRDFFYPYNENDLLKFEKGYFEWEEYSSQ